MTTSPLRRKFKRFILTHGHARDIPRGGLKATEKPIARMFTSVVTTSWYAQGELWMPNTQLPHAIFTGDDVREYKTFLTEYAPRMQHNVTIKLTKNTTFAMLRAAKAAGVIAVKVYPEGITFSPEGWTEIEEMYPAVEAAISLGLIICWHGEQPGREIDTYDREEAFMENCFRKLVARFPDAQFNVEHISTKKTLEMVMGMPENVTGGITLHHLLINRNDVLEWNDPGTKRTGLNPFHHCRPPVQREEDRLALLHVALHADLPEYRRFHFGPDSAAHLTPTKLCECGCPGVFISPVLGPLVVELYEQNSKLDSPAFEAFTVQNGARRYGLTVDHSDTFELEKVDWIIPSEYGGVVPFFARRTVSWRPTEPAALKPELLLN